MNSKVLQWIRPEVRGQTAYHVTESSDVIKLDAMENPYTWPDPLITKWLELIRGAPINRYPDPAARKLKGRLRESMEIDSSADVILGNGSDELIQMVIMAVAKSGCVVMAPEPTFVMYKIISTWAAMNYVGIPLNSDFSLDLGAMLSAIRKLQPAVVFLAYPNNPTGNLFPRTEVQQIIETAPGLVVIDEAYHAFAGSSFMDEIGRYDNLLVMRTVSKMGLAGLRLGYMAGLPQWISEIDKLRLPYNISVITQLTVDFALEHREILDKQAQAIKAERENIYKTLEQLQGVTVFPTHTNFILFRVAKGRADGIFKGLLENGVLIKNMSPAGGLLQDCLRATIGTPQENATFLKALKAII